MPPDLLPQPTDLPSQPTDLPLSVLPTLPIDAPPAGPGVSDTTPPVSPPVVVVRPKTAHQGGWCEVNPAYRRTLAAQGIDSAAGFLELPGEVVSGHPDRHVRRVELPGQSPGLYLKRQHVVGWRERLRNSLAGFGPVSRCVREGRLLRQLRAAGLAAPQWVAYGEDRGGRAFLLLEEFVGSDLRAVLSDTRLSPDTRRRLLIRIGRRIAQVHAAGFTTPDLSAKHVLVSHDLRRIVFLDWQSAVRKRAVATADRVRALAALHASVADELASPRERLRLLRAALAAARKSGVERTRFSSLVRQVTDTAAGLRHRRSFREQRLPVATTRPQRLVWLEGEAVCAIPEVAAVWPACGGVARFYGCEPGTIELSRGELRGVLVRGRSVAPLGRLAAWLRGHSWRSPGAVLGRILFHLERYGIPAPRLLAFGQRHTGPIGTDWFTLHTPPGEPLPDRPDAATCEGLGRLLRRLHEAGCRPTFPPRDCFGRTEQGPCVRNVAALRLCRVRRIDRSRDLAELIAALGPGSRDAVEAGYHDPRPGLCDRFAPEMVPSARMSPSV